MIEGEPDIELCGTAMPGTGVMDALRDISADVILLDVNLPDISGTDVCAEFVKVYHEVSSGSRGFLLPRLNNIQRTTISNPPKIFMTDRAESRRP